MQRWVRTPSISRTDQMTAQCRDRGDVTEVTPIVRTILIIFFKCNFV